MISGTQQRSFVVDDAPTRAELRRGERTRNETTTLRAVFIQTQAREPAIQLRLAPTDTERIPDEWTQLGTADRDLAVQVLRSPVRYIDAPLFHEPGAESILFGGQAYLAAHSTHFAGSPLPEHAGVRATPSEEILLFRQFNYCRMQQRRIQGLSHREAMPLDTLRRLLAWTHRAMKIRNRIVESNMPLILAMLKESHIFNPDFDELISEGHLALLRCAHTFDCSRGFRFSTYACRAILKCFVRVSVKASHYRSRFSVEFDPAMGPSDQPKRRSDEAQSACLEEIGKILAENRAVLSVQEHEVICARFTLDTHPPDSRPQTLQQLGRLMGVTKERVRQIQNKALQKLRAALEDSLIKSLAHASGPR